MKFKVGELLYSETIGSLIDIIEIWENAQTLSENTSRTYYHCKEYKVMPDDSVEVGHYVSSEYELVKNKFKHATLISVDEVYRKYYQQVVSEYLG